MNTVVITGSARGLGLELAKEFRKNNYNVVISDLKEESLASAKEELSKIQSDAKIHSVVADVTSESDLEHLLDETQKEFQTIDIFINNAGVNQHMVPIWEVSSDEIKRLVDIDLKGAIIGTKLAIQRMMNQGHGAIYGIEGYGSNDAMMLGLSIYGTSKRGLTYFLEATAKEIKEKNLPIQIGALSPGIMITNFITHSLGEDEFELPEKTKKVYNILGDYPDVIAKFLVEKMLKNNKPFARINWLTNRKAAFRFMTCAWNKRDLFTKK